MIGAFLSELLKLRRRGLLLGGGGLFLGFTALVTILGIERASKTPGAGRGLRVSVAELSQPNGLVRGLDHAGPLMGIVMLGIFAAAFGSEYSTGALRNLLVREPRRVRFLAGKYVALLAFGVLVLLAAVIVSVALAFVLAPSKGISTSAWTSSAGVSDLWSTVWHLVLASLGFGTLGAALALIFRSPVAALAIGVAWVLPAEAILSATWTNGQDWLPGQLLQNLASGGSTSVSLARTGLTLAAYWVVVAVGTSMLFSRRDVAS
jgi:ABC-2 type transport system permease protein